MRDDELFEVLDGTTLAEVLYMARQKTGMTQEEVAKKIGVSPPTLSDWKNKGIRRTELLPRALELTRLAGMADSHGIVVIVRHLIPRELHHLRKYVGCTVRRSSKKVTRMIKRNEDIKETFVTFIDALPRAKV